MSHAREYARQPETVPPVHTKFRTIQTPLPAPGSLKTLDTLWRTEPVAMQGQPPVVWEKAEGFLVQDKWGNRWIDWSSGVLVANSGHAHPDVVKAIVATAQQHLLTTYAFPTEQRAKLTSRLSSLMPEPMKKIFLLTTGSEATECAIKLCRAHGVQKGGRHKHIIITFEKAFHGRTMGSQQAGGIPALKDWIVNLDPGFVQVQFPDGFRTPDVSFTYFLKQLEDQGVRPEYVAGVMLETYQGGSASFAPPSYMQKMRDWCDNNSALLVCDEVQAGFGRTGKLWGFEHYGIVPDITTWGKGVSSSMPLAFVAGPPDILDIFPPGSMSSTHSGNPICSAAALANIEAILREDLAGNAKRMGDILHARLQALRKRHAAHVAFVDGKGLVAGVHCVKPGTMEPAGDFAFDIVRRCWHKGLLLFNPVGFGGGTVKICPPLVITAEAMEESCNVLDEAFAEALL
jgi:4-aminobutyrate aminotransferase / (S)-3-amino-2-methylpropionate transaminase / 5-aminovalerate transaminase